MVFRRPFLTSAHGTVHLPLVGDVELASAVGFDFGVMLTVIGAVLLSLRQISRVEQRAEHEPVPEGPMDIRLPADRQPEPADAEADPAQSEAGPAEPETIADAVAVTRPPGNC